MPNILQRIKSAFTTNLKLQEEPKVKIVRVETGTSGTEIFSGIYNIDHLDTFNSVEKQELYRQMETDPQLDMLLKAVIDSIKSASWEVDAPKEADEKEKRIKDFVEFILFEDMKPKWQKLLNEMLKFIPRGYSLFELIHKNDVSKEFGPYTGIRKMAFREQNTIEYWNLKPKTGEIISVEQISEGDLDNGIAIMRGEFLSVFTNRQTGDNYEGVSEMRSSYGPWLRKNLYYKLQAIGIEKMAIGTPVGTVPKGSRPEDEQKLEDVLASYTAHQKQYILLPEGYTIEIIEGKFKSEHVVTAIKQEDTSMAKAMLANFLELGVSTSSGSFALGNDLSDFFLATIQHFADMICDEFNDHIIKDLVKLNFGVQERYPKLKCSGITDKVGKELSEIFLALVNSGTLTPDEDLETHVRKRYKLPPKMEVVEEPDAPKEKEENKEPEKPKETPKEKAEREKEERKQSNAKKADELGHQDDAYRLVETPRTSIKDGTKQLKEVMEPRLKIMADKLVNDIMRKYKQLPAKSKFKATKGVKAGTTRQYKDVLSGNVFSISSKALSNVRKEVPGGEKAKLICPTTGLKLVDDKIPKDLKDKLKFDAEALVDTQAADLEKATFLHFNGIVDSVDDPKIIQKELDIAAQQYVEGNAVPLAASVLSADSVNKTREFFFFSNEVVNGIESFTFVNPSPVSQICKELAGRTFAVDDSASLRNTPPLHFNCKSYLKANLVGDKLPEVTPGGLTSVSPKAIESRNLEEPNKGENNEK